MTKTIDGCMFFNELEMIDLRFAMLNEAVDFFAVVESRETHSGLIKPLYFQDALESGRFDAYRHKILYYVLDTLEGDHPWARERYHRAAISKAFDLVANPGDLCIVGDVDEIPTAEAVRAIPPQGASLELTMFYYDFNHRLQQGWGIGALPYGVESDANKIRTLEGHHVPTIANAGFHASYFMSPEDIVLKLNSFMHASDVAKDVPRDPAWIAARMAAGEDLFGRTVQIEHVEANGNLPAYVSEHIDEYRAMGWVE